MSPRARELAAAGVDAWAVDIGQPLTDVERRAVVLTTQQGRARLLARYRDECRRRRVSSLGVLFAEMTAEKLARALVLMTRAEPENVEPAFTFRVPCLYLDTLMLQQVTDGWPSCDTDHGGHTLTMTAE